jgi:hypothetical protein
MTGYAIADEHKSIWLCKDKSGGYSLTTDKNRAIIFDTKVLAETVFKSNLSKLIKSKGVFVQSVELQVGTAKKSEEVKKAVIETPKVAADTVLTDPGSSQYIVFVLSDAIAKLNSRHVALSDELSKYDRQRTDVEHYIELNAGKLNAYEGYKAYKLLQDVLVQRRKIKDELEILQVMKDKMAIPDDIAKINTRVQELSSRHYEPREFKWLFTKEEMK